MALKTFNVDAEVYAEFSKYCKKHGISMSKKVEKFIRNEMDNVRSDVKTAVEKVQEIEDKFERERKDEHPLMKYC